MYIHQFKTKLVTGATQIFNSSRWLFGLLALAFALTLVAELRASPKLPQKMADTTSADTYIPPGFVLVPIELENYQALDSILGNFGTVDLFSVPVPSGGPSRKVASQVKILRAPLNPSHFAVLVKEKDAPLIVQHAGAFFAVIQNPNKHGTQIEGSTKKSRITVENFQ